MLFHGLDATDLHVNELSAGLRLSNNSRGARLRCCTVHVITYV